MKQIYITFYVVALAGMFTGCKKLIDVAPPKTGVTGENVFNADGTAISALTSIYASMSAATLDGNGTTGPGGGVTSLSLYPGLSSDELRITNGQSDENYIFYYRNNLTANSVISFDFWNRFYPIIFSVNAALEGLNKSSSLTPAVKKQLLGEAKFIRAFSYFYMINLYGDVPFVTSTDYTVNAVMPRTPLTVINDKIIEDLKDAQNELSPNYLDGTLLNVSSDRARPSKWAAMALLARVYLYKGDWVNAEMESSAIIANSSLFNLSTLTNAFLKASLGNSEAIWQLQPVVVGWNTQDAKMLILTSTGPTNNTTKPVYLNTSLVNAFELGDQRKSNWVNKVNVAGTDYYYPYKYKSATLNASVTEYTMVFRLSELYLIRAEARAQLNKISDAQSDLNAIRTRAGLPNATATDKSSLLSSILHERQVELFTEWGHRWFDLKRTSTIDSVMNIVTPSKGGAWESTDQFYPIPQFELKNNPELIQNPGY